MRSCTTPRALAVPLVLVPMLVLALARDAGAQATSKSSTPKAAAKSTTKSPAKSTARSTAAPPSVARTATRPATARPAPGSRPAVTAKPAAQQAPRQAAKPAPKPMASVPAPAAAAVASSGGDGPAGEAQRAARSITVHEGPGGRALATLAPNTIVTPLLREGGWVRVRLEAWVPERDLLPADTAVRTQLAAADLRADPEGTRGRTVRWEVELLAFQVADVLRRELAEEEPYLLVRGPGEENALLYLALPPSLVAQARGIPPLTRVLVTARVRNGRSAPAGVPVLDLLTFTPLRGG